MKLVHLAPFLLALTTAHAAWFHDALVGIETGPTGGQFGSDPADTGYAANFDGTAMVRRAAQANSDYIVIWARDGVYTYYDSEVQTKAPGLGDRDVLAETVAEARKHNMPVIAYCVLQYPTQSLADHPDWKMRDADGNPIDRVCFNSPYIADVKKLLAEMLAYGIDGFHLDMVDQGFGPPHGCYCQHCETRFHGQHGHPMPTSRDWDAAWEKVLTFRYESSARFEKELAAHVRSLDPQATVDFNYHGNPPFGWEVGQLPVMHANNADFVTGETGIWGFSSLGVGLNAAFYRAATPGTPFQVAIQRGVRMYHDQTTRPLADMRWELLSLLSHGAFVTMVDKTAYDGWLDPVFYDRLETLFAEAHAKKPHFAAPPLPGTAIYFSARNRDWLGRDDPQSAWQGFLGTHKTLVYEHLPWSVVFDENTTPESLAKHQTLILPNTAIISPQEVERFTTYVQNGGNLVVLGASGTRDRYGNPLGHSVLEPLVGATWLRTLDSLDNHLQLPSGALAAGIPADWPFLVKGHAVAYQPTTATPVGRLLPPHRTVRQRQGKESTDWPMSADRENPAGPAILINKIGRGTVLTIAASPGEATASEHAITEARLLLRNAVRFLDPAPPLTIAAPKFVETVPTYDRPTKTLRVHFVAYPGLPATTPPKNRPYILPPPIEDRPLYRATVQLSTPFKNASTLSPDTRLTTGNQTLNLTIEDIHETLVIENIDLP